MVLRFNDTRDAGNLSGLRPRAGRRRFLGADRGDGILAELNLPFEVRLRGLKVILLLGAALFLAALFGRGQLLDFLPVSRHSLLCALNLLPGRARIG